jgi:hypothetical protein
MLITDTASAHWLSSSTACVYCSAIEVDGGPGGVADGVAGGKLMVLTTAARTGRGELALAAVAALVTHCDRPIWVG